MLGCNTHYKAYNNEQDFSCDCFSFIQTELGQSAGVIHNKCQFRWLVCVLLVENNGRRVSHRCFNFKREHHMKVISDVNVLVMTASWAGLFSSTWVILYVTHNCKQAQLQSNSSCVRISQCVRSLTHDSGNTDVKLTRKGQDERYYYLEIDIQIDKNRWSITARFAVLVPLLWSQVENFNYI